MFIFYLLLSTNLLMTYLCIINEYNCNVTLKENDYPHYRTLIPGIKQYQNLNNGYQKQYSFMLMPANNHVLSISQSGKIQLRRNIDREELCQQADLSQTCVCKSNDLCRIPLQVWISKTNVKNKPPVRLPMMVCISDVNDNAPILHHTINRKVPENSQVPYQIYLPLATDTDSPKYSQHKYTISCGSSVNFINLKTPNAKTLELVISKPLDFETKSSYQCKLKVCDSKHCTKSNVFIKVIDQNDNAPKWDKNKWVVSVKENTIIDSEIVRLTATDRDSTYSELYYSLMDDDSQTHFSIEPRSGIVRLANYLDYEALSSKQFVLVVKVTDNGLPQAKSATGSLTINVIDVNDNPPRINLQNSMVSVHENKPEVYLGFMSVSDADKSSNGLLTCYISQPRDKFQLRLSTSTLNQRNYDIYSLSGFDREIESRVDVRIVCSDKGSPALTSTAALTLVIEDVDDNDVKFEKKIFTAGVSEGEPISSFVIKLLASDRDSTSQLEYYLADKRDREWVQVDKTSGTVLTHRVFDREQREEYRIKMGVRESANHMKNDSALLVLKIWDVNDNVPTFNKTYSFKVSESHKLNSIIGHVQAFDLDKAENGSIEYSQLKSFGYIRGRSMFFVHRNGAIRTFKALDYEKEKVHHLVVCAHDKGSRLQRTGSTTVVVSVLDENDNPPRFRRRFVSVKMGCSGEISVSRECQLHDNDTEPANTQMEFKIIHNPWMKPFNMHNKTGDISVALDPSLCKKQTNNRFKLRVQVRDPTKPQFRDECTINIKLETVTPPPKLPYYPRDPNNNDRIGDYNSKPRTQSGSRNKNGDYNKNGGYNNNGAGFDGYDDNDNYRNDLSDGSGSRNSEEFDSSIFLIIILIALSLLLIVLLTCVAFMAKRCRQEQTHDHDELSKIDPDVINCAPNHASIQRFNRYSAKNNKDNNSTSPMNGFSFPIRPQPDFQMLPNHHQIIPDAAMTINSLLSDPSNIKSNMSSCTEDPSSKVIMNSGGMNFGTSQIDLSMNGVPSSMCVVESPSIQHKSTNMNSGTTNHYQHPHISSLHDYQPLHTAVSYATSKTPIVSTSFV